MDTEYYIQNLRRKATARGRDRREQGRERGREREGEREREGGREGGRERGNPIPGRYFLNVVLPCLLCFFAGGGFCARRFLREISFLRESSFSCLREFFSCLREFSLCLR